jgi:DNA-binding NtrC family response regulator
MPVRSGKILLAESNSDAAQNISTVLTSNNYMVKIAKNSTEFFNLYDEFKPDILILNIVLKDSAISGMEIFRNMMDSAELKAKVVIYSDDEKASWINQVYKFGSYKIYGEGSAFDYHSLLNQVNSSAQLKKNEEENIRLKAENLYLKKSLVETHPFIGESEGINIARDQIIRLARADEDMFIVGETGTGKEMAIHFYYMNSLRFGKAFKTVNCSALTPTLIESELFGHVKGSFTNADKNKTGLFEQCNNGILFLDEITNLSMGSQSKLLRAVENQEIQVVGGESKKVDVRLLFASNASMEKLAKPQILRNDLFYRIEGNLVELLPLRERGDDVILLMNYFLNKYSHNYLDFDNNSLRSLKDELLSYNWPGNVRELKNFCKFILINEKTITPNIVRRNLELKLNKQNSSPDFKLQRLIQSETLKNSVVSFEKDYLSFHLQKYNWQISETARNIGIERTTLYKKIKAYNLTPDKKHESQ